MKVMLGTYDLYERNGDGSKRDVLALVAYLAKVKVLEVDATVSTPLSQAIRSNYSAVFPGKPVPTNVGSLMAELIQRPAGDSTAYIELDTLKRLGFPMPSDAPSAGWAAKTTRSVRLDEEQLQHVAESGYQPPARSPRRQVSYAIEEQKPTRFGCLDFQLRNFRGSPQVALHTALSVSADGQISQGTISGQRQYDQMTLTEKGTKLVLSGKNGVATFFLDSAGRAREVDSKTNRKMASASPHQLEWLFDALLDHPELLKDMPALDIGYRAVVEGRNLRNSTIAPMNAVEMAVWKGVRTSDAEIDVLAKSIEAKWGTRPLLWHRSIDEPAERAVISDLLHATGGQSKIRPSFLLTVAMGEGLYSSVSEFRQLGLIDDLGVSGFGELGTDTFGSAAGRLKAKGYLPTWFKEGEAYTVQNAVNEKSERVVSAEFSDRRSGFIALVAMLSENRSSFERDAKVILGAQMAQRLTQREIEYFTYVYFNAGPGFGRKHLETKGLAAARKWSGPPPAGNRIARFNAIQRMATVELIDNLGFLPDRSPLPLPGPDQATVHG